MMRVLSSWALSVALLYPALASAQVELRVRAQLLEKEGAPPPTMGVPLEVVVEARHTPGRVALLPDRLDLPDAIGERRAARVHERAVEGELELDIYRLQLIPFDYGLIELPPLPLAVGSTVAETEPLLIEVESALDPAERAAVTSTRPETLGVLEGMTVGNPPPAGFDVPDFTLGIALGLLGVAIIAFFVGRAMWKRRRYKAIVAPPPPPPRPAHEVAVDRLDDLEGRDWVEKQAFNPYFTELSHILRSYLGQRYRVDALERTVDELYEALEARQTPGLDLREAQAILLEADQAKFAKYSPSPQQAREALARVRILVDLTRERPAPPPTDEKEAGA